MHPNARAQLPRAKQSLWLMLSFLISASLFADTPSGGPYSLRKQAIAAGGNASSAGPYTLVGTVGQSSSGPVSAGATQIQQGFHAVPTGAII